MLRQKLDFVGELVEAEALLSRAEEAFNFSTLANETHKDPSTEC